MKRYHIQILVIIFFFSVATKANTAYKIGQKSLTYVDATRNRPLDVEIWYPTTDNPSEQRVKETRKEIFQTIRTIPNASIPDEKFPILLVSHGTGGNRFSLTWFIKSMVEKGYIVVSLDHYGNSTFNKIPREFVKWWERAIDIQFVLTNVLKDEKIGAKIDQSRIGGVGFSLGGYTQIALAGGYVDRDSNRTKLPELPPEFPEGEEEIDFEKDPLILASYKKYKDLVKDDRIKAFFVMTPAIGFGFHSKEQTKDIIAPIFIVAGKGDKNTPTPYNAENYHRLIKTSTLYLFDAPVGHYVFLNEGTEFGKKILPELTIDPPKVNRKAIHKETIKLAEDFFRISM
ncbi:alpha/beta hydrolase family protein [Aquimarina litoralis]|uniref:alpha/beta hydrolase family protein n=1 Tax=Aquimarina litoralis TaxID=584605 RepID=UPI001C5940C6|nr:hypothetical protein [Aquimarina litoralis]MBW1295389.1 dienelactone hydrolase [Aquimarina litoralis]